MVIKFYNRGEKYFEFTNFAKTPFTITEKDLLQLRCLSPNLIGEWKTSEHLFQAAKFVDPKIIEEIRQASDIGMRQPKGVFWLANSSDGKYKKEIRGDWFKINLPVMRWILEKKFINNELLKSMLIGTGNEELVENSGADDAYWGNGADGKGENKLGKVLMELREKLKQMCI